MEPIKTDNTFYHNLLIKKFHLLLHIAQCVSFLPYPSYALRQALERRHNVRTCILRLLNGTLAVLNFAISLSCYLALYIYYPELMYKGNLPAVLQIMYHVENWLRVVLVLIALVGPRVSGRFIRETIDTLVHTMKLFDRAGQMEGVLGGTAIITNRLLLLYCCHTLIVTVTVWISTEQPVSTLLNVSYLAPYVTIAVYILLYQALLSSIGGLVRCLNDSLHSVTLLDKRYAERPHGKHTTVSYIKLHSANQPPDWQVNVATVEKLSTLHTALMRLAQDANKHFGVLILIILLSTFIQINMLLLELYHNIGHPTLPEYCLWILFLHAIVHFTFFFVIAKSNHSIQQQNERTLLLLHEFKCSWSSEQNVVGLASHRTPVRLVSVRKMAWNNTETDRLRQQLRLAVAPAMHTSQCLSLAPYPLTLFQANCSMNSVRIRVIIFFRYMFSIATTLVTVASQFVLFVYYPETLYEPTVPIFIVILYYIVNVLQALTTANMMIGCERRRMNYEGYFEEVLPLIRDTEHQRDCPESILHRKVARALVPIYSTVALLVPIFATLVLQHISTIPYVIAHTVPFIVSFLILTQYYSVFAHLSSIMRKLNERLVPLMNIRLPLEADLLPKKPNVYNILGQPLASLRVENNYLEEIEQLRLLHLRAVGIAGSLSEKFGFVIILIVVAAFASVNIELLELYQCVKLGSWGPWTIVLKFMFAVIKFSFYILIAYPNRLIQQENQHTLFMLYRIKRTSFSLETNGAIEHYISQITNLQDVHQACGMINLDMKLISNVVAAITSIMVVLIQFSDNGL